MLVLSHVIHFSVGFATFGPFFLPCVSVCESPSGAEKWYCKNIDDCAKLKHGCGALGLCALTIFRDPLSEPPGDPQLKIWWLKISSFSSRSINTPLISWGRYFILTRKKHQNPMVGECWSMLIIIFPLGYHPLNWTDQFVGFFLMFFECCWRAWTVGAWIFLSV